MKFVYAIAALAGLSLTVFPSIMVFNGALAFETHKTLMLLGTLLWFVAAPLWLKHQASS